MDKVFRISCFVCSGYIVSSASVLIHSISVFFHLIKITLENKKKIWNYNFLQ